MYVEDLLALNFMMNIFLLYLTARLTGRNTPMARLLAGGVLAALYSLVVFWPEGGRFLYSWAGKLAVSFLIVLLTFRPRRVVETLRLCGAFYLASFFLAGTVFAMYYFANTPAVVRGGIYYLAPPRPGTLLTGVFVASLLLIGIWHFSEKQRRNKELRFRLRIRHRGKEAEAWALVDTGNQLREPVSGRPLCVASYRAVRELLPDVLRKAYDQNLDPVASLTALPDADANRFGVVPFRSLENAGMLVTFRPESVFITGKDGISQADHLTFALSAKPLSLDNDAEVLLSPALAELWGGVGC